jgi:hypothetical protein
VKSENIRKTYIKIKRRYDSLRSVAADLSAITVNMDLSSFGEFGKSLKQMKKALEEDWEGNGVVEGQQSGLSQSQASG